MITTEKKCPETAATVQSTSNSLLINNNIPSEDCKEGVFGLDENRKNLVDVVFQQSDLFYQLGLEKKSTWHFPNLTDQSDEKDIDEAALELVSKAKAIFAENFPESKEEIDKDDLDVDAVVFLAFSICAKEYVRGLQEYEKGSFAPQSVHKGA